MASIDVTQLKLTIRKRWFYYPAIATMVILGRLGILRDPGRAAQWLADHAMLFGAEPVRPPAFGEAVPTPTLPRTVGEGPHRVFDPRPARSPSDLEP